MTYETTIYVEPNIPSILSWLPNFILDRIIPQEIQLEVSIDIEYHVTSDSIGEYEFWGYKCYDYRPKYVQIEGVNSVDFDVADLPLFFRVFKGEQNYLRSLIEDACNKKAQSDDAMEACENDASSDPRY